jgi:hypothetical protein
MKKITKYIKISFVLVLLLIEQVVFRGYITTLLYMRNERKRKEKREKTKNKIPIKGFYF